MSDVVIGFVVSALRGAAAVALIALFAGGIPRLVVLGLAAVTGAWVAMLVGQTPVSDGAWIIVAARELVIGATIGLVAALPLIAAQMAGRLVDASAALRQGPYRTLFAVLAAAVFVGIDGHVIVVTSIVESYRDVPAALVATTPRVLDAIGALVAQAVRLSVPWLVTAAVVQIAAGVGMRVAGRAGNDVPAAAGVPAALAMMTAALVGTFAIAFATFVRGA
jgi:flagellar biosynthetic protein FliR